MVSLDSWEWGGTTTCFHGANERLHDKDDLSVQQVGRINQRIDFICGFNNVFRCSSRFEAALSCARVAKSSIEDVLSITSCIRSFVSAFFTCLHLIEPLAWDENTGRNLVRGSAVGRCDCRVRFSDVWYAACNISITTLLCVNVSMYWLILNSLVNSAELNSQFISLYSQLFF